jgi:putative two-component system response regulator
MLACRGIFGNGLMDYRVLDMIRSDLNNARVVICDDSITNVMVLAKLIEEEGVGKIDTFTDPRKLQPFLAQTAGCIDLLVLDIEMPYLSGFDVMANIDEDFNGNWPFSILVITGLQNREVRTRALNSGASDFLDKPFDQVEVVLRVRNLLEVRRAFKAQAHHARHLEEEVRRRTAELDRANDMLLYLLAQAGEMRDSETGKHVDRVGRYSRLLAEGLGLPAELCSIIEKAAPLHDIGKIGIPDQILHKRHKLDVEEREQMNTHTIKGLHLLGEYGHDSMVLQMAASIAHNHHEHWDGSGYPRGMQGEAIPIEGRIVAMADVFDALTTQRPYKQAWSVDKVRDFFQDGAGSHFDPSLTEVLLEDFDKFVAVMHELADD